MSIYFWFNMICCVVKSKFIAHYTHSLGSLHGSCVCHGFHIVVIQCM